MSSDHVHKTYKLYLGGGFPRSESGRSLKIERPTRSTNRSPRILAQIARASRKDLRGAVEAAQKAFGPWSKAKPMHRGQILYRMAEMLDSRGREFEDLLVSFGLSDRRQARLEVEVSCNRLLWYAGWADKLGQVLGTVNPVSGPYFDFSSPEAMGVVAVYPGEKPALLSLVSTLAPVIVGGNCGVFLVPYEAGPIAITFAEILATSDVPGGVCNFLTGTRDELLTHFVMHRGFQANFLVSDDPREIKLVEYEAADHVKRGKTVPLGTPALWRSPACQGLDWISPFLEIKTTWHPIGL